MLNRSTSDRFRPRGPFRLVPLALALAIAAPLLFSPSLALAQASHETVAKKWDALLKAHVSRGEVNGVALTLLDYAALKADPGWQPLLDELAAAPEPSDETAKLAFWINAYNILAAKVVADNYPVDSIKDAGGWVTAVWDVNAGSAAGSKRTLNQVEHEILRPMGDPRVHAAIVCASVSCPDLRPEAFFAEKLGEQLDDQLRKFLANPAKGAYLDSDGELVVSKIFSWFKDDFEKDGATLDGFLKRYLPARLAREWDPDNGVGHMDYDWSLNDAKRARG